VIHLYQEKTNKIAQVTIFTISVFIGPMVAPFIGGFIVISHLGWRWTMYLSGILASAAAVANFFFLYETYAPVILVKKAEKLRQATRNWAIHAKLEETEVDLKAIVERNLTRPLHMLIVEPIVLLMRCVFSAVFLSCNC
jgi:DHA1 family multidrug resistance protein-like MFS transporter